MKKLPRVAAVLAAATLALPLAACSKDAEPGAPEVGMEANKSEESADESTEEEAGGEEAG